MSERLIVLGDTDHQARLVEDPDDIDNPILAFFLTYWRRKRGAGALPLSDSFVPKEIGAHLPWVVLADPLPDYVDFRYRLVGTRVCEYFLGDGTGKTIREAFAGMKTSDLEGLIWLYRRACVEQMPIRLTAPGGRINGVYYPNYDALYLPFASDGVHADRVVIVFTFNYREFCETRSITALLRSG
ncbi:MAG: PAS domain-containing protein [Proteobacteria bacterium]|nr:PAS domain-containing protein [Pseudomonadota bacterium]